MVILILGLLASQVPHDTAVREPLYFTVDHGGSELNWPRSGGANYQRCVNHIAGRTSYDIFPYRYPWIPKGQE